jgi:hypothetical protein
MKKGTALGAYRFMIFVCEGKLKDLLLITEVRYFTHCFGHRPVVDGRIVTVYDQKEILQD